MAELPRVASGTMNMDEYVLQICKEFRPQIEAKIKRNFTTFIPLLYSTQDWKGISYSVKILVEPAVNNMLNECIHVGVRQKTVISLHPLELDNVRQEKTILEPL